jgi:hypothetical protein
MKKKRALSAVGHIEAQVGPQRHLLARRSAGALQFCLDGEIPEPGVA